MATSPAAALRLPRLLTTRASETGTRSTRPRGASTPSTRTVTGSPRRTRRPAAAADDRRLGLVEVVALAPAHPPRRQEALIDVAECAAEGDERPGVDQARHLALERRLGPGLEQLALEQEGGADVVGVALDRHRLALALRAPHARLANLTALGLLLPRPEAREQGPVRDQVGVAADRRREVAVRGAAEPGVAEVLRRSRGPVSARGARVMYTPRGRGRDAPPPRLTRRLASATSSAATLGVIVSGDRRRRQVERRELLDQGDHARPVGPLVDAVERRRPAAFELLGDALVGADHQLLDQRVRLRLLHRPSAVTLPSASNSNSGSVVVISSAESGDAGRRAPRPRAGRARVAPRPAPAARPAPGEELVELLVGEPHVRADPAAVEAGRARRAVGGEQHLDRDREPLDARGPGCTRPPRAPPAASAPPSRGRRRSSPAARPRRRAASPGARARRRRRCGSTAGSRRPPPTPRRRRRSRARWPGRR